VTDGSDRNDSPARATGGGSVADSVPGDGTRSTAATDERAPATGRSPGETRPESDKAFDPAPAAGIFLLFALTVLGGLALVGPYRAAEMRAFEDPTALSNVALIVAEVLVATALFLLVFRYDRGEQAVRLVVLGAVAFLLHSPVVVLLSVPAWVGIGLGSAVAGVLWLYPEWYVVDLAGVAFGATAVALFGVSLSPLPVVALLSVMAAYDAYSVYVSEHMQSLGSGVVDLRLPMVFVVPVECDFSLRDADDLADLSEEAMLLGLGDAIFPGLLVASAAVFLDAPAVVAGLNLPAVGALVGAVGGFVALEAVLFTVRRAHAGLPALNGGVVAGYLLGAAAAGVPVVDALGLAPYL